MSLFKLTAGDGYTYLIRQVAASDSTERGYQSLGDYYEEAGESPGRWWGAGLDSLGVSGRVTEEQMRALFGEGRHPNADAIEAKLIKEGYSPAAAMSMTRLGQKFRLTEGSTEWQRRLAAAYAQHNTGQRLKWDTAIPEPERARIRTEIAQEFFQEVYGRSPLDARELTGFIARESRPTSTAVAGYDCTFSPVKSISALWASTSKACPSGGRRSRRRFDSHSNSVHRSGAEVADDQASLIADGYVRHLEDSKRHIIGSSATLTDRSARPQHGLPAEPIEASLVSSGAR
jgi:hypothetical protein